MSTRESRAGILTGIRSFATAAPLRRLGTPTAIHFKLSSLQAFGSRDAGCERRGEPNAFLLLEADYCGPSSKSTNVFGIGCGRGRGLSGVGCPAAL
jgi:hypothetical protein